MLSAYFLRISTAFFVCQNLTVVIFSSHHRYHFGGADKRNLWHVTFKYSIQYRKQECKIFDIYFHHQKTISREGSRHYLNQNPNHQDDTRMCGFLGTVSSALMHDCLMALGFSEPCVTIWEFNILNTKQECFEVCLLSYITSEPNNKPDGSLNDCLQCDEDKSGPNFKYFSGRTR